MQTEQKLKPDLVSLYDLETDKAYCCSPAVAWSEEKVVGGVGNQGKVEKREVDCIVIA